MAAKVTFPLQRRPRRLQTYLVASVVFALTLFYLLLSIAPCMIGPSCYHGYQSRFSFDADKAAAEGRNAAWMADLPDHVSLSSLSVPGTHDTMTYDIGTEKLQCQNWNLTVQLEAGLRYLDIRARLRNDTLQIYHGDGYTGFSFEHVLLNMFAFLEENPSEAIIMRLKEEGRAIGQNNITFEDAFNNQLLASATTSSGSTKHFHAYDPTNPIPTLGDIRSKIFLLQEFTTRDSSPPYGLKWNGPLMALEDYWIIPDVYHLADKWTAIRNALETAATAQLGRDGSPLHLAHVSASVGVLPIEAAAGPLNRTVTGMNDMTGQWLQDFEDVDGTLRTGIVILDFPGKQLIESVLRWNKKLA